MPLVKLTIKDDEASNKLTSLEAAAEKAEQVDSLQADEEMEKDKKDDEDDEDGRPPGNQGTKKRAPKNR